MVAGIMKRGTESLLGVNWWLAQERTRDYKKAVLDRLDNLPSEFKVETYGTVAYGPYSYAVKYVTVGDISREDIPTVLITGGVHGYEHGGVEGCLQFLEKQAQNYQGQYNFVVLPCVSPAAFERDMRLNGMKLNPNRGFYDGTDVQEARLVMDLVRKLDKRYLFTIDCHETTWTDPIVIAQEGGDPNIDSDNIEPYAYILESITDKSQKLGPHMADALEAMGLPVNQAEMIDGVPSEGGVIYGLDKIIPTLCMSFMLSATKQSITTEPFVTKELHDRAGGLDVRAQAQIAMIDAALKHGSAPRHPAA